MKTLLATVLASTLLIGCSSSDSVELADNPHFDVENGHHQEQMFKYVRLDFMMEEPEVFSWDYDFEETQFGVTIVYSWDGGEWEEYISNEELVEILGD